MCYDISFTSSLETLQDIFPDLVIDDQLEIDFDSMVHAMGNFVFPPWPIIYQPAEDVHPHLRMMGWGVIAYYAGKDLGKFEKQYPDDKSKAIRDFYKDLSKRRNNMLNARSERVLDDKTSYWYKIRNRRCLIPVTGTYEHREVVGMKNMIPYLIRPADQPVFFLPGLYSVAELPDAETGELVKVWTFTLITRAANAGMKNIHNHGDNKFRMSLYVPLELSKKWLDPALTEEEYRSILQYEMPFEDLTYHTVFTVRGRKPRPDGLPADAPFTWEKLPPLGVGNPES